MRKFSDMNNLNNFKELSRIFTAAVSAALKTLDMEDASIGVLIWDKGSPDAPGLITIDAESDEVPLVARTLLNAVDAKTYEAVDMTGEGCDCPACRSARKARAKAKAEVNGRATGGPSNPDRIDGAFLNLDGMRQRFVVIEFVDPDGTITPVRPDDILALVRAHNQREAERANFVKVADRIIASFRPAVPAPVERMATRSGVNRASEWFWPWLDIHLAIHRATPLIKADHPDARRYYAGWIEALDRLNVSGSEALKASRILQARGYYPPESHLKSLIGIIKQSRVIGWGVSDASDEATCDWPPIRKSGVTPWTDPVWGVWISPWDGNDHNPGGWAVDGQGKPLVYSSRAAALNEAEVMCDEAPDGDRTSYIAVRIDGNADGMLGVSKQDRKAKDAHNVGLAQGEPSGSLREGAGEGTGGDPGGGVDIVPPAVIRPQGQRLDKRGLPRWDSDAGRGGSGAVVGP